MDRRLVPITVRCEGILAVYGISAPFFGSSRR